MVFSFHKKTSILYFFKGLPQLRAPLYALLNACRGFGHHCIKSTIFRTPLAHREIFGLTPDDRFSRVARKPPLYALFSVGPYGLCFGALILACGRCSHQMACRRCASYHPCLSGYSCRCYDAHHGCDHQRHHDGPQVP